MTIELFDFEKVILKDEDLRFRYDHRSSFEKTIDVVVSLFRGFKYFLTDFWNRASSNNYPHCGEAITWKKDSEGLCVFLHGLYGHPSVWQKQLAHLENASDKIDQFAPFLPHKGACSLEEASAPVLNTLLHYIERNPNKPICLIGMSNGSRTSSWLEVQLRKLSPETSVKVSNIAGIHFGSPMMNILNRFGVSRFFYPQDVRKELAYGSLTARSLLAEVLEPMPEGSTGVRDYDFYASTEDLIVPNLGSSLPFLNKGERHYVVHGHSHDSIIKAVAQHQINSCVRWIKELANSDRVPSEFAQLA